MSRHISRRPTGADADQGLSKAHGFALGSVALAGIAVAVAPLRRRLCAGLLQAFRKDSRGLSVSDDVLTERVRAQLKLVCDELHLPQVRAQVVCHVATLHGSVHRDSDADSIEEAAAAVAGVEGVIFHVHEMPPVPAARSDHGSAALRQLLAAARGGGCTEPADAAAARTVLAIFLEHLPAADRTGTVVVRGHAAGALPTEPVDKAIDGDLDTLADARKVRPFKRCVFGCQPELPDVNQGESYPSAASLFQRPLSCGVENSETSIPTTTPCGARISFPSLTSVPTFP
jgi:hypothetical protein